MLWEEKMMDFERFLVVSIAREWILITGHRVDFVCGISKIFKNFIFFKSKIFLQDEPVLCHIIA